MVKGFRSTRWELPGGKVEIDEKPAHCLQREVVEEIGVDIWKKISNHLKISIEVDGRTDHYFIIDSYRSVLYY